MGRTDVTFSWDERDALVQLVNIVMGGRPATFEGGYDLSNAGGCDCYKRDLRRLIEKSITKARFLEKGHVDKSLRA